MATKIEWLGHDGFRLTADGVVVYIDPYEATSLTPPADIVLISHDHFDHFVPEDIDKVRKDTTVVVGPEAVAGRWPGARQIAPGEELSVGGVTVRAVEAYNTNKFREPGEVFHPRGSGVGYLVTLGGEVIYHSGDTDVIPEMSGLRPDVALIPVSGTYVMTAEEAAEAVRAIEPGRVIPMHYGTIVGTEEDALRFQKLVSVPVEILSRTT
ncbi:MAG: MBL fold metallo-hydrolase [Candidatus Dormibacteria bacterium]